jgi:[acyl-carrier-protein] S-malonyltransferase
MSVASHCELLSTAVEKLSPSLNEFITDHFETSVISNVSTTGYNTKNDAIELLSLQLTSPVKYKQSISANDTVDYFIEFGNGSVLKGINRKITKTPTLNVSDMASLEATLGELND